MKEQEAEGIREWVRDKFPDDNDRTHELRAEACILLNRFYIDEAIPHITSMVEADIMSKYNMTGEN